MLLWKLEERNSKPQIDDENRMTKQMDFHPEVIECHIVVSSFVIRIS
jgi:hypothetical protein